MSGILLYELYYELAMDVSDFDYEFDDGLIAQSPAEPRHDSRLFYLSNDRYQHLRFRNIPSLLKKEDVLVINKSKVIPARVQGKKETGGKVELLFYRELDGYWECLVKGNVREGIRINVDDFRIHLKKHISGGKYLVECDEPKIVMEKHGTMPTPPYIKKPLKKKDEYQTIYADEEGSVAAPTAGLHFTESVLSDIKDKGVEIFEITLHVGPGTFLPIRTSSVEEHTMDEEHYFIDEKTARGITKANEEGRRVIAVGSTTIRTLESASDEGRIKPGGGWTDLYIYPGYRFQSGTDLFLTNFHLPKSTPLMMVCAFAGKKRILNAYEVAMEKRYRFYSFGDCMLVDKK